MNAKILHFVRYAQAAELADVLFKMVEKHPETFQELFVETDVVKDVPFTNQPVRFTNVEWTELLGYDRDRKVTAIKRVREITGIGLKEAKDLVEKYLPNLNPLNY